MTCMAYSENAGVPPLHVLEDGHQGTPLAAVFLGQADQLLAEPLTFGDKHFSVSPIDMQCGLPQQVPSPFGRGLG